MSTYQIVILAPAGLPQAEMLRKTIERRFSDLGIAPQLLVFFDEVTVGTRDKKSPTIAAYFGLTATSPSATAALIDIIDEAVIVLPVVSQLDGFNHYVPRELSAINGMALRSEDPALEQVASVLLEGLGLLRKNRRLFISYRRMETRAIAIQVYELLDSQGFDVFLDSHSIRPGEPFQEVLWHRLADTDVVVLLDSPGFLGSRWTEEELAHANSTNLQILQIVWPGNVLPAIAAFSTPFALDQRDFFDPNDRLGETARLRDACLSKMAIEVESLRARALAARHSYLVHEFISEVTSAGFLPLLQPDRYIQFQTKSGESYITVPTVGVPDAIRYQEIEDEINKQPKVHGGIILLFDERGIRDKWMDHLGWLDRQKLAVKSLQVAKAQAWLGGLA
jgi:hypothetical protein